MIIALLIHHLIVFFFLVLMFIAFVNAVLWHFSSIELILPPHGRVRDLIGMPDVRFLLLWVDSSFSHRKIS